MATQLSDALPQVGGVANPLRLHSLTVLVGRAETGGH